MPWRLASFVIPTLARNQHLLQLYLHIDSDFSGHLFVTTRPNGSYIIYTCNKFVGKDFTWQASCHAPTCQSMTASDTQTVALTFSFHRLTADDLHTMQIVRRWWKQCSLAEKCDQARMTHGAWWLYTVDSWKCVCGSSAEKSGGESAMCGCEQVCLSEVRKHPKQLHLRKTEESSVSLLSFPIKFTDCFCLSLPVAALLIGGLTAELSVNNISPSRWGMVSVSSTWESCSMPHPLGHGLSSFLGDSTSVLLVTVHSRTGWDTRQLLPSLPSYAPTRGVDRSFHSLVWSSSTLHPWRNPRAIVPVSMFVSLVTYFLQSDGYNF